MGLYIFSPPLSSRMGILDIVSRVKQTAVIEYGSMGHMVYARQQQRLTYGKGADLYTVHMSEADIALGGVENFLNGLHQLQEEKRYRAIFNLPSTVPLTIGLFPDEWVEEEHAEETSLIGFETGGFECHVYEGMEEALEKVVSCMPMEERRDKRPRVHILGLTAIEAPYYGDKREIGDMLRKAFGEVVPVFYPEEGCKAEAEDVVVALSGWSVAGAKHLVEASGATFVQGNPYGYEATVDFLHEVGQGLGRFPNGIYMDKMQKKYAPFLDNEGDIFYHQKQKPVCVTASISLCNGLSKIAQELGYKKCICYSLDEKESTTAHPYLTDDVWIQTVGDLICEEDALVIAPSERLTYMNLDSTWCTTYSRGMAIPENEKPYRGFGGMDTWIDSIRFT